MRTSPFAGPALTLGALSLVVVALQSPKAHAARPAMDPQMRVHGGLSMVESPQPLGAGLGFDSRVGRNLALDAGVFFSAPADLETTADRGEPRDHFSLRHGLYAMPGLRLPHPQPRNFRWDVYGRAGGGVVWTEDRWERAPTSVAGQMDVAGYAGVDGVIMKDAWGLRLGARAAFTSIYDSQTQADVFYWGTQYSAEVVYQFGFKG